MMSLQTLRLAALLAALAATSFLTGGGWYEQTVIDPAWPHRPGLVRPAEGGANRKLFWVPANVLAILTLPIAVWAGWPASASRYATLVALGLYLIIHVATVTYFAPAVLRVEKQSPEPDDPRSHAWVWRSRWRTAISLIINVALGIAIVRIRELGF